jgi:DNA repair protein RecO (recombination protein O)
MADKGVSNFHLFFLAKLTRFLGIFPRFKSGENDSFLDLKKGITSKTEPPHSKFMDIEETRIFYQLVGINLKDLPELSINRQVRIKLLGKILEYYSLHFDSMGEIKSLPVLKEVFNQ